MLLSLDVAAVFAQGLEGEDYGGGVALVHQVEEALLGQIQELIAPLLDGLAQLRVALEVSVKGARVTAEELGCLGDDPICLFQRLCYRSGAQSPFGPGIVRQVNYIISPTGGLSP